MPTKEKSPIKRVFWDIEVSANLVLAWRAGYDLAINHDSIVQERKIICICWKYEGEKKIHSLRWDRDQDDKAMLVKFMEVANDADELVGHYADRFDLPWVRTRCLIHGLDPFPLCKTVDTKAISSKWLYTNSNKLDYLGSILGLGKKIKTDYDLWKNIMLKRDPVALNKMVTYCCRDVELLENVYHKLKYLFKPKTHAGVFAGKDKWTCPYTGSINVVLNKRSVTSSGSLRFQMRNEDNGAYYTISEPAYRKYLEAKKKSK
jgi:DNA polymerase III epsilon subunit-like protein